MGAPGGFESGCGVYPERSVNGLLEPGSANNLNASMYACSNLIERSRGIYFVSRFARVAESALQARQGEIYFVSRFARVSAPLGMTSWVMVMVLKRVQQSDRELELP